MSLDHVRDSLVGIPGADREQSVEIAGVDHARIMGNAARGRFAFAIARPAVGLASPSAAGDRDRANTITSRWR